jgi:hypothetical protein
MPDERLKSDCSSVTNIASRSQNSRFNRYTLSYD